MQGHAQKAKELLDQANNELKAAAQGAKELAVKFASICKWTSCRDWRVPFGVQEVLGSNRGGPAKIKTAIIPTHVLDDAPFAAPGTSARDQSNSPSLPEFTQALDAGVPQFPPSVFANRFDPLKASTAQGLKPSRVLYILTFG